jgi:phosphate transport system permease protein
LFGHSISEFLFSGQWNPGDSAEGGGHVGAAMFLAGSLVTCSMSLLISLPVCMATAIFMTEIAKPQTRRLIQPAIELFTGIPSVVYGWIGMTVLIPFLRVFFPMPYGFSVLAGGIVLAVMIFPTITTMTADAMTAVPKQWREASYGLGATRWETIFHVVLPAAKGGIFTGIILGLARALGEALAVAMVIGQMKVFPTSLFLPASTLTTAIASDMGGAMEGGEYSAALWTMALVLFLLSFLFIYSIHRLTEAAALKGRA